MVAFELCREFGKVVVVGGAFLLKNLEFNAVMLLVLFPIASWSFLRSRRLEHVRLEDEVIDAEDGSTGMLVKFVEGFQFIRECRQWSAIIIEFEGSLKKSYFSMT